MGRDYNLLCILSEAVPSEIDEEVESIVLAAYKRTESILQEHIDKLHVVAKALVEREKIDANEFYALMDGKELPPLQSAEPPKADEKPADDENAQPEAQNAETQAQSVDASAQGETVPSEQPAQNEEETPAQQAAQDDPATPDSGADNPNA